MLKQTRHYIEKSMEKMLHNDPHLKDRAVLLAHVKSALKEIEEFEAKFNEMKDTLVELAEDEEEED